MSYISNLKFIKTIILDLDGVLTDGTVLVSESGEQLRSMSIKDGFAIQLAAKMGYLIMVVSGGNTETVRGRLEKLGIQEIHIGIKDKVESIEALLKKHARTWDDVLFMGDDVPDLPVMHKAKIATCPADASSELKSIAHYISDKKGGEGCVRDVLEQVMRAQETWNNEFSHYTRST